MPTSFLDEATEVLWNYSMLPDDGRITDAAIVLGCHDTGVPTHAAALFHIGKFPLLVMTGAVSHKTRDLYPEGEAHRFARIAAEHGVPPDRILVEPTATNTQENIEASRRLLADRPLTAATLVTRPYHARRALLTARLRWPEVEWGVATGEPSFAPYAEQLGRDRVLTYLAGEVHRLMVYRGQSLLAPDDPVPDEVPAALAVLDEHGFTPRPVQ